MDTIKTYLEASRELGVAPVVVATLSAAYGLTPKPVPRNGKAKGLDPTDMRVLRKALNLPTRNPRTQGQPS